MKSEKELLKQLHNLKSIQPDRDFVSRNRDVIMSQIKGSSTQRSGWFSFVPQSVMSTLTQPVAVVLLFFIVVFGGGFFSLQAAEEAVPGDSLYIAKRISEKTQYALTFTEKSKARLGIEFAGKRAKELSVLLLDETEDSDKEGHMDKLTEEFKKEISEVKNRLARINETQPQETVKIETRNVGSELETVKLEETEKSIQVFNANLNKEDKGIEVTESEAVVDEKGTEVVEEEAIEETKSEEASSTSEEEIATSTPEVLEEMTEVQTEEESPAQDPQTILLEAGILLDANDLLGTITKLDEAHAIIEQGDDTGEVKGETEVVETSTSTPEVGEEEGEVLGATEEAEEATSTEE